MIIITNITAVSCRFLNGVLTSFTNLALYSLLPSYLVPRLP